MSLICKIIMFVVGVFLIMIGAGFTLAIPPLGGLIVLLGVIVIEASLG